MTTKIEFGNNIGYKINNYVIKKKILDYVVKNVEFYKMKYHLIESEDDLLDIKNNDYILLPNIVGDDYIFISCRIKEVYYVVLIEKKTIDFKNLNYNNINMICVKIRLKLETYNGTIFQGRIVNIGGCCVFIINQVYMINGINNINYNDFNNVDNFIKSSYIYDDNMNVILFKVNRSYNVDKINYLIKDKLLNSKYKFSSIDFISNDKTYRYYFNSLDFEKKECILYGKLIDIDVIELYSNNINNNIKRIDIAHIPDIKTSRICNKHISNKDLTIIKCHLDYKYKKWIPNEIIFDNVNVDNYEKIIDMMTY